jgi:hypothetical protein
VRGSAVVALGFGLGIVFGSILVVTLVSGFVTVFAD